MASTQTSYRGRRQGALSAPPGRSRVTNGALYLSLRDTGSPVARRLRDLINSLTADLGGAEACSVAEQMLIRRAAQLALQAELLEQAWQQEHRGTAPAKRLYDYNRVTNTLRRVLRTLGMQRRARDVTPDLQTYLAQRQNPDVEVEAGE